MKKTIYSILFLACSFFNLPFSSQAAPIQESSFSSFMSIMFGRQTYQDHEKTQWSGTTNGDTNYRYGIEGASSELGLGVNKKLANNANMGAMIFVSGSPIDYELTSSSSNANDNYRITHTLKNTWGIRILPGYYLNQDSMIYIPLGLVTSQFQLNSSASNNVASASKNLHGFQAGIGFDHAINNQLHFKIEYLATQYEHFNVDYSSNTQAKKRHYILNTDQFHLGLAYYFDTDKTTASNKTYLSNGWYAGAAIGKSVQTTKFSILDTDLNQKQYINGTGALGLLFLGYGHTFPSHIYLAAEASTFHDDAQHRQSDNLDDTHPLVRKAQMKYGYSLSLLPGYQVAPTFRLYGRAGFAQGYFYNRSTADLVTDSQTKNLSGFLFGFGSELALNSQWSLRADYQETWYQAFNQYIDGAKETLRPTMSYYLLSIVYHF